MFLVTTALDETFPLDKETNILFLGEWCKVYNKSAKWKEYKSKTLDYHWSDRLKLSQDSKYLEDVYERYLKILTKELNKIHNEQHSERYWRIIIGPWLMRFIAIVFDKYLLIEHAFSSQKIDKTYVLDFDKVNAIPVDMHDFVRLYVNDDWNHFIFSSLIKEDYCKVVKIKSNRGIYRQKKNRKNLLKKISMKLNRFNKIGFYTSYLERKSCVKLQMLLGQIPALDYIDEFSPTAVFDLSLRESLDIPDGACAFEGALGSVIKTQIPCAYLESYKTLKKAAFSRYASKTRLIVSGAASLAVHDDFKVWSAHQVEDGAQLVVSQHGGYYGTGQLMDPTEKGEIEVSSVFFSWGWRRRDFNNIKPMPAIKLLNTISHNPKGDVLVLLLSLPRYSSSLISSPTSSLMLSYIQDQIDFLSLISDKVSAHIKLRMFANDYGWNMKERLSDCGFGKFIESDVNLNKKFVNRLSECRLCIATYNGTTYLETFYSNFPTLIFWDKNLWEINQFAKPYFESLHKVGILHYSAKSLTAKLEEVYGDPMGWWMTEDVQSAKKSFCAEFASVGDNPLGKWRSELEKMAAVI